MRYALALAFLTASASAQLRPLQDPREPELPVFHAQSDLVTLLFQVSRNKHFNTDLTSADIVLLEDGAPRKFTVFEGPQDRTPIELVLLFDVTTWPMGADWNPEWLYGFTARWTESNTSAIVATGAQEVRASIYHFDGVRLERLCRSTADASQLLGAFHRLRDPIRGLDLTPSQRVQIAVAIDAAAESNNDRRALEARFRTADRTPPSGTPISIDLPPGNAILPAIGPPGTGNRGWPLEAAIGAMRDASAGSAAQALRVLVEFSAGRGGTTTLPEDVADAALALGVSVYPVVLNYHPRFGRVQPDEIVGRRSDVRSDSAPEPGRGGRAGYSSVAANFARLGSLTGGRSFQFTPIEWNADALAHTVDTIRTQTLDRALSQYIVGFTPQSSTGPREHKLEIKLVAKSSGKVTGGKRKAIY